MMPKIHIHILQADGFSSQQFTIYTTTIADLYAKSCPQNLTNFYP